MPAGKAEFMNPGGSVKDRAALFMIEAAEKSGQLQKGGMNVLVCVLYIKSSSSSPLSFLHSSVTIFVNPCHQ